MPNKTSVSIYLCLCVQSRNTQSWENHSKSPILPSISCELPEITSKHAIVYFSKHLKSLTCTMAIFFRVMNYLCSIRSTLLATIHAEFFLCWLDRLAPKRSNQSQKSSKCLRFRPGKLTKNRQKRKKHY